MIAMTTMKAMIALSNKTITVDSHSYFFGDRGKVGGKPTSENKQGFVTKPPLNVQSIFLGTQDMTR